jgi:hypothetical protein
MSWNKEDLSNYNTAPSPWYRVEMNGKVDISAEQGRDEKIGLQPDGMFKLVKEWLNSGHGLSAEQKEELITALSKKDVSGTPALDFLKGQKVEIKPVDAMVGINEAVRRQDERTQASIDKIKK